MIVDTSVLFDALVPGAHTIQARTFFASAGRLASPELIAVEIAAALTKAVRREAVTPEFASQAHQSAGKLIPLIEPVAPFLVRAFHLSLGLVHPYADCVFLAHAEASGDVMVTTDAHFARKVAASPHARSIVELADWRP